MEYSIGDKLLTIKQITVNVNGKYTMYAVHDLITGINEATFFSRRLAVTKLMIILRSAK